MMNELLLVKTVYTL